MMFKHLRSTAPLLAALAGGMFLAACQSAPPVPVTNWDFTNMHLVPPREVVVGNAPPLDNSAASTQIFRVALPHPTVFVDNGDNGGGDADYGGGDGE